MNNGKPKWEYLKLEMFDSRHAVALMFLRQCQYIVELGGWETPLSRLTDKVVIASHLLAGADGNYGFCALGVDMESDTDWDHVMRLFNGAARCVLEAASEYGIGMNQIRQFEIGSGKRLKWTVELDLSMNEIPPLPGYRPFMKRRMFFYE